MTQTDNVQIIRDFFHALSTADLDHVEGFFNDAGYFQAHREVTNTQVISKRRITPAIHRIYQHFPKGISFSINSIFSQGNQVAVEAEMLAAADHGNFTDTVYMFMIEMNDGRIEKMRAYIEMDSDKLDVIAKDYLNTI